MTARINLAKIHAEHERQTVRAFRDVIQSIRDQAVISEVARLLETGNINGVIDLLQINQATFQPFEQAITEAYRVGGLTGAAQIGSIPAQAGTLVMRFNVRNPRAEKWLTSMSSRLVTDVVDQQRNLARTVLTESLAAGNNPRAAALDLVGRVDRATGRRAGGFIGATDQQAQWVSNARSELISLDDASLNNYLSRRLRDARFDSAIKKAAREGKPLPSATIDNAITRMQARAERYRGEVIARTETLNALRAGQFESIQQAIELGEVDQRDVLKRWDATGDSRTRPEHNAIESKYKEQGIPMDQPFVAPDGSRMMFPGDSSLGAAPGMTIQCRCRLVTRINFAEKLRREVRGFG